MNDTGLPAVRRARSWPARLLLAGLLLCCATMSTAMTPAQRERLDLNAYEVTDPSAGYFDVPARKTFLRETTDPVLREQVDALRFGTSCRSVLALPVVQGRMRVPMFYEDREGWTETARVFLRFEDAVSLLAGSQLVADDAYHGECLLTLLSRWAQAGAFQEYQFDKTELQTWFQVESSLFAAALAYSVVRNQVKGMEAEKRAIEQWLSAVATRHMSFEGGQDGTCCNNHLYRRAVYATIIGVLNADDSMFRFGVSAIHSALSDASSAGALRLEMRRGSLAARYQNFATMYLVFIAHLAQRQGYDLFSLSVNERTLTDIVKLSIAVLQDAQAIAPHTGGARQNPGFQEDGQYYAWLELLSDRAIPEVEQMLRARRPLYNRSLGGFMTLYFGQPLPPLELE